MRIITIGSALVDIFIRSDHFSKDRHGIVKIGEVGGKFDVDSFVIKTGGGASNTGVGFSRLGFEVATIAETGHDEFSKMVIADLKKEGVDTSLLIHEKKEETGGSVILVLEDGSRAVLVHRGASSMLDPKDINIAEISGADWVHISSLSGQLKTLKHIFATLRYHNVNVSWNPGSSDLKLLASGQLPLSEIHAKVLFLNKEEWEMIEDQQDEIKKKIEQVVITDGDKGGNVFLNNGMKMRYKALPVEAVDNTGAGDAFVVGYVTAILRGRSSEDAVRFGAKNSASVVKYFGGKEGLRKKIS
ncbi:MAG: carbohydrate kinase family protein [Candidatus Pacebacteria bacterium]|nr:carbohydrate kinase family protein [Candidatus Paceibacterota bacterium]